jgi:hypothetical protein
MTDWKSIKSAPQDEVIWLGCESDPAVDTHMFFVDLGWKYKDGFWSVIAKDIRYYSHWARITSPIPGAAVTFHSRGEYMLNEVRRKRKG